MDKQTFWQIIDQAKRKSGTNLDKRYKLIVASLKQFSPEEILLFHQIAGVYIGAAEENMAVWAACKAIEGYASDDTFLYFCCWLVSEGYETYKNAVKNPETLADVKDIGKYKEYGHSFEMLMNVPFQAYEQRTGQSLYELMSDPELKQPEETPLSEEEIKHLMEGIEWIDDSPFCENEETAKRNIPKYLPKLTAKFKYNPEIELKEMEQMMKNPEAALDKIREMLIAQGVDINKMPELAPQPPMPAAAKQYDEILRFSNGLAAVRKGDKWGNIDAEGREVIPVQFDHPVSFRDVIMPVCYNGKYGYINTRGEQITPYKYNTASLFYQEDNQYAWVEVEGKKGFINRKGQEVIPPKYDELHFGEKGVKGRIGDQWEKIAL